MEIYNRLLGAPRNKITGAKPVEPRIVSSRGGNVLLVMIGSSLEGLGTSGHQEKGSVRGLSHD